VSTASISCAGETTSVTYGGTLPQSTLFGNTPRIASTTTGIADVDSIYGTSKLIRLFWADGANLASPLPARKIVGSCKDGETDAQVAAWAAKMYRWTYQHEIDSKLKKGTYSSLSDWRARMAALVALNIPGLSVILTADCFISSSKNPADYIIPGVTHLGVDFDGLSFSDHYHDYGPELAAVQAYVKKYGLTWGVGEFGANRAANDPDGSARAAWLDSWSRKFKAAGAEYVCYWEFNSQAGSTFTKPAEIATVKTYLAS
jgi:hypothetical protein